LFDFTTFSTLASFCDDLVKKTRGFKLNVVSTDNKIAKGVTEDGEYCDDNSCYYIPSGKVALNG
jgi:hypothetical protein